MSKNLQDAAKEIGIGQLRHHIFICLGPDCCSKDRGQAVWQYLKKRLKELGLTGKSPTVHRSKVDCLRICQQGPIVVIYPEGTWYHQVDEAKMERIVQSHIVKGNPLIEEAFAMNPLNFCSKN